MVESLREQGGVKGKARVLKEEIIELEYYPEGEDGKRQTKGRAKLQLKKVCYQDEKNRYYEFLSNSMESTAEEITFLYKKRWEIEIPFKKVKQNFQLHYFYGECYPHSGLVHTHRSAVDDCHPEDGSNKKGILRGGFFNPNTPDKLA